MTYCQYHILLLELKQTDIMGIDFPSIHLKYTLVLIFVSSFLWDAFSFLRVDAAAVLNGYLPHIKNMCIDLKYISM